MRRITLGLAGCVLFSGLLAISPALAQSGEDLVDKCVNDPNRPLDPLAGPPSCTFDDDGNVISRSYEDPAMSRSGGGTFAIIALLAIVLGVIPFFVAANMAKSRGDRPGTAVLYTLAGGWLGLALYHASTRRGSRLQESASSDAADSISERLSVLSDLRRQGAITAEEYAERRRTIIDET